MRCTVGRSEQQNVVEAIAESCRDFLTTEPDLIVFFADSIRFNAFTTELKRLFPHAVVIGSSTYVSFSSLGLCHYGLNIMALQGNMRLRAGCISEVSKNPMKYMQVIGDARATLGDADIRRDNTVFFLLNPAGTRSEELVLDAVNDALGDMDIPIIGGSASSEVCSQGCVSLDGVMYEDSTVFVLLHLERGKLHIRLENIFEPTEYHFRATKVDIESRIIYELDNHPAADVLCRVLNVPFEHLEEVLHGHPLGRTPKGKLYITEVGHVNADHSLTTYCRVYNQTKIVLLQMRDMEKTMSETLADIHSAVANPVCSILINCYSRTKLYTEQGWMDYFTNSLDVSLGNYIGLTSHGEQLDHFCLNLTLLVLSFGE